MNELELQRLLLDADRLSERPAAVSAEGLLRAARRRRIAVARRRQTAVGLAAAAIVCGALGMRSALNGDTALDLEAARVDWSLKRPVRSADVGRSADGGRSADVGRSADGGRLRLELERLEGEARVLMQVVGAVNRETPASAGAGIPEALAGAEVVRLEAARSAAITWQYAVQVEQEFHDAAAARREYERLIERFPATKWAQLAAVSLERLTAPDEPLAL